MKKIIYVFVFALMGYTTVNAQAFEVGTNVINVGAGFGGDYGYYSSANVSPVFSASFDTGVWDIGGPGVISLGGYIGHRTFKYYSGSDNKWSQTAFGVRGAYHYNGFEIDNLDIYGGVLLGYYFYSDNDSSTLSSYGNRLDHSGFIGGRWFFTDAIAAYLEAGYGIANVSAGVAFKF